MLYRFFDCGIYDNAHEPATTVWIHATSQREAAERVLALLSLTWNVEPEQVCINAAGTDELEIARNSPQRREAGDRRLAECGSTGDDPHYLTGHQLLFLNARDQARLRTAFDSARLHARELQEKMLGLAGEARAAGKEREADEYEYRAQEYAEFAQGTR